MELKVFSNAFEVMGFLMMSPKNGSQISFVSFIRERRDVDVWTGQKGHEIIILPHILTYLGTYQDHELFQYAADSRHYLFQTPKILHEGECLKLIDLLLQTRQAVTGAAITMEYSQENFWRLKTVLASIC